MSERDLSRRDLFTFWRRKGAAAEGPEAAPPEPPAPPPPPPLKAQVDWMRCLAYTGSTCDLCKKACPEPLAIKPDNHGHPRVYVPYCTGCGECVKVCPTEPPSIVVKPLG